MASTKINWIERLESDFSHIYTLHPIAQKVIHLLNDPLSSAHDLGTIIKYDYVLVSRILRIVNSVFYSFENEILSIDHALAILGFDAIKNLIFSVMSKNFYFKKIGNYSYYNTQRLWVHSVQTALGSKIIAEKLLMPQQDEPFTAGLLHDIGKALIIQCFENEIEEIDIVLQQDNLSLLQAEEEILGANHSIMGNWLLEKWNLPTFLREATLYHHFPSDELVNLKNTLIVYTANILSHLRKDTQKWPEILPIENWVMEYLKLSNTDCQRIKVKTEELLPKYITMLS